MRRQWLVRLAALAILTATGAPVEGADPVGVPECRLDALPGLAAQRARARRGLERLAFESASAESDPRRAMRAAIADDFWRTIQAVQGHDDGMRVQPGPGRATTLDVGLPPIPAAPCSVQSRARDRIVWSMTLAGYSAREIVDVVDGHLARGDLDAAARMLMAGRTRSEVVAFVESRWREPAPAVPPAAPPGEGRPAPLDPPIDAELTAIARRHGVDPALVRAVIAAESAGNARAVSGAGAVGLMQLMPVTAAALGVDPRNPVDNLRGGIAYLAGLLRAYDSPTLALVAYNAGPQHADRVRAGQAVPYRETRRYLDAIRTRYPLP
jgi:soluble lytic murein transglycosylase-like protein